MYIGEQLFTLVAFSKCPTPNVWNYPKFETAES